MTDHALCIAMALISLAAMCVSFYNLHRTAEVHRRTQAVWDAMQQLASGSNR